MRINGGHFSYFKLMERCWAKSMRYSKHQNINIQDGAPFPVFFLFNLLKTFDVNTRYYLFNTKQTAFSHAHDIDLLKQKKQLERKGQNGKLEKILDTS